MACTQEQGQFANFAIRNCLFMENSFDLTIKKLDFAPLLMTDLELSRTKENHQAVQENLRYDELIEPAFEKQKQVEIEANGREDVPAEDSMVCGCSQNLFQKDEHPEKPRESNEGENTSTYAALKIEHIGAVGPANEPEYIRAAARIEDYFSYDDSMH
jgi:hypothetical protein